MMKICPSCNKEFESFSNNGRFCCRKCQGIAKKIEHNILPHSNLQTKVCPHCGKEFTTNSSNKRFCSKECHYEYVKTKKRTNYKETKTCPNCGKSFETTYAVKKFCCTECKEVYETKMKFKDLNDIVICKECGFISSNLLKHIGSKHSSIEEYCQKHNCSRDDLISHQCHNNLVERQKRLVKEGKVTPFSSENNPSHNQDCKNGRNSPYSKNFRKYNGLTDKEKEEKIKQLYEQKSNTTNESGNNPLTIEYYMKQGLTEDEAVQALKDRQTTFSLEKCIEKYGEEEGHKRWAERQKKWLSNYKKQNFSMVSQDLFWKIYEIVKGNYKEIYFATLTPSKEKSLTSENFEYTLHLSNSYVKPDFFIKDNKKIIEFDGEYWHNNSEERKEKDIERANNILKEGYTIFRVKERDYQDDPKKVINECIIFLDS